MTVSYLLDVCLKQCVSTNKLNVVNNSHVRL